MDAKKIITIIVSIVLVAALTFLAIWGSVNFNKVKEGMKGAGLYTETDINEAYDDGYTTALDNKTAYEELIDEYRDKLSEYETIKKELTTAKYDIAQLNSTVSHLQGYIAECEELIKNLNAENYMLTSKITLSLRSFRTTDIPTTATQLDSKGQSDLP